MKIKLLFPVLAVFFIPFYTYPAVRVAKITQFIGDVKTVRNEMVMGVRINLFLVEGDWIETGEESEVFLLFKNGSKLRIGEKSKFTVETCMDNLDGSRDIQAKISVGSVICNIKKITSKKGSFTLSTPTATCSIRGTVFETVVMQDGSSTFNVLEGIVDVSLPGTDKSIPVHPNKQAKVTKETKTIVTTDIPAGEKEKLVEKAKKISAPKKTPPQTQKGVKEKEKPSEEAESVEEEETGTEEEAEAEEAEESEEQMEEGGESPEEEALNVDEGEPQQETIPDEAPMDIIDDIIREDVTPIKEEIPIEEIIEKVPSPSSQ